MSQIIRKPRMKNIFFLMALSIATLSCEREDIGSNDNTSEPEFTVTTWAHTFQPSTLYCSLGDSVYFDLGGSHNAIEVSDSSYIMNDPTPIENGFEFGYGAKGFFVPQEAKTYYYVCVPHLPEMKAMIIVE